MKIYILVHLKTGLAEMAVKIMVDYSVALDRIYRLRMRTIDHKAHRI